MPKGYSAKCAIRHREVRKLFKTRQNELRNTEFGDLARYISKEYYLDYLHAETGYKIPTIKMILNRSKKEIDARECKTI